MCFFQTLNEFAIVRVARHREHLKLVHREQGLSAVNAVQIECFLSQRVNVNMLDKVLQLFLGSFEVLVDQESYCGIQFLHQSIVSAHV